MTSKWTRYRVSDIGKIVTGKTPKTSNPDFYGGSIPFLTPSDNMSVKYVLSTSKTITELGKLSVKNSVIPADSVCVSCIGSDLGKVVITTEETVTNQQINSIVIDKSRFDINFVYYSMVVLGRLLNYHSKTSTAVPIVNKSTFSQYEIFCPSLDKQKQIASILSALDYKIALNTAINENLEQQAQAIFKSWFVNFEPFGSVMPDNWSECTLDSICSLIIKGITPKYTDHSDQLVINQKCIRNHHIDLSVARFHIPKKINEKWLQYGDVVVNSTGTGTLGRAAQVLFVPNNLTVDSHVTIIRATKAIYQHYLGLWATSHEHDFEMLQTGSTGQTDLPRERLKQMQIVLPSKETLNEFSEIIKPIADIRIKNQQENQRLSALRDTLLPKLMNGEIDVSAVKI